MGGSLKGLGNVGDVGQYNRISALQLAVAGGYPRLAQVLATPAPAQEEPAGEPAPAMTKTGYHVRLADRLGVWACRLVCDDVRRAFYAWKDDPDPADTERMAGELVDVIRWWQPVLPVDWMISTPPQGASAHKGDGHYCAGLLAAAVGRRLGRETMTLLQRTDEKRYHHPREALRQGAFTVCRTPPAAVLLVDDLITSRATMTRALSALAGAGVPAFGFVWGMVRSNRQ
jgi:hypothetical protein